MPRRRREDRREDEWLYDKSLECEEDTWEYIKDLDEGLENDCDDEDNQIHRVVG